MMMPIGAWAQDATVEAKWGASATELTEQGTLLDAISAAEAEGSTVAYIRLQNDVATESLYDIDSGVFTLDLNGHEVACSSNEAFAVMGSDTRVILTDTHADATGKVTAGGRAVYVDDGATLIIEGGIYGGDNYAVFVAGGSVSISGGTFETNSEYTVYCYGGLTTITGGTFEAGDNGTIGYYDGMIDFTGFASPTGLSVFNATSDAVTIGAGTIVLPSGYCFYDQSGNAVTELARWTTYTIGNEPETKYTVTFDANGGEGTMEGGISYGDYLLPECSFTAPEGKMFKAWQVGESEHQPGETVTITANTTITALWTDYVAQIVIKMKDQHGDGWHGDAIVVKKDGEEIGNATIESGSSNTVRYDYDKMAEYTFYWQFGSGENRYPSECSFEILVDGETVLTVEGGCGNYEDGQLIHTIEPKEVTVVETLTLADGELAEYSNTVSLTTVGTLTYTRTLPNLEWNALYLPFEISMSELADNYDVAYINDVHSYDTDEDGEIDDLKMEVIKIRSGILNANYPYLIRAKSEEAKAMTLTLTDATLYRTVENKVTCSSVFMQFDVTGTYSQKTADDLTDAEGNTSLVITTDGSWQQLAEESVLNPFRLYLTMTALDGSPVKVAPEAMARMCIVTRGETTGIENSKLKIENSGAVYDLQGRRVNGITEKGIYIVNGRKVVIK